jgi:hypothetical protein
VIDDAIFQREGIMLKKISIFSIILSCVLSAYSPPPLFAKDFEFYNGRVSVGLWGDEFLSFRKAKHKEQYWQYSQALTFWRSRVQMDITTTWFQYFYESAPDFNDKIHNSMAASMRYNKYQAPFFARDDIIHEAYIDINKGPLSVRVGKQKVVWGDLELKRTTDIVNPLDLRYSSPGVDDLDELKVGLWMIRMLYQSSLPGDLLFELLINPGDYQLLRQGIQGSDRGSPAVPNEELGGMGITGAIQTLQYRAEPRFSLHNFAIGGRLRGLLRSQIAGRAYDWLWTLQYYTSPDQNSLVVDNTEAYRAWAAQYSAMRVDGIDQGVWPKENIYDARRYNMFGLSLQTFDPILTNAVIIGEFAYFKGLTFNRTIPPEGTTTLDPTTRDLFTYGLSVRRPWKTAFFKKIDHSSRGYTDVDLSIYQGWILGSDISQLKQTFSYGNRSETTFTLQLMTAFRNQEFTPVIRMLYNTRNWGYVSTSVTYSITSNWKTTVGYTENFARNQTNDGVAAAYHKDRIYWKVEWQF